MPDNSIPPIPRWLIYEAVNSVNGKRYVGKTGRTLSERIKEHAQQSARGSSFCFHEAIRKYGISAFCFRVLDVADDPFQLTEKERAWVAQCDSVAPHGYNMTRGGQGGVMPPGRKHRYPAPNRIDLIGRRFGRLVILGPDRRRNGHLFWNCKCDCGNEKAINGISLRRGASRSCGCYEDECRREGHARTHGASASGGTRTFHIWTHLKGRCGNPNNPAYADYGGRGISVCSRWESDSAGLGGSRVCGGDCF